MGTIVILMAAVIEIAFVIYCIKTKSNQKRTKSWIHISAFAAFVILTMVTVIQWGFRWKLLALVLSICAIIGSISLIRNKEDKKEYKTARIVLKAIAMWLVIVIAATPVLIFPQNKLPGVTGEHEINTAVYTYTDNNRIETFGDKDGNRKVTVEFWYPKDAAGKYPLVIFSHGAFGVRTSNTSTFNELASNGYVVCSINHPYHSMFNKDNEGSVTVVDKGFLQEVIGVNNGVYDEATTFKLEQKWLKLRTDDMNFVLDTLIKNANEKGSGQVYQIIDTGKIGLMGHSLGGAASAQLARERNDIGAVINLDGGLLGEQLGFVDGKYIINHEIYPVPLLCIYTDAMKRAMASITDPSIVIPDKLILATAPKAYEVYFKGTNHFSVTDLPLLSPAMVKMINGSIKRSGGEQTADKYYVIEKMNSIVLEFFDSNLKGKGSFQSAGTY